MSIDVKTQYVDTPGRYEDQYGHWLAFFQHLAESDVPLTLSNVPGSWSVLSKYLGHQVLSTYEKWPTCSVVLAMNPSYAASYAGDLRLLVEATTVFRPELVDALWKCDMQWRTRPVDTRSVLGASDDIVITNNGSYHRPEIKQYFAHLDAYVPTKKNVVLVPCAADKPYPAPVHRAVLDRMPDTFYLANLTGVLGVVPQDLWPVMPRYDSGIPNEWRLLNVVRSYFARNRPDIVVVYADYYSIALKEALRDLPSVTVHWVNPVQFYADYLDLLEPQRLLSLERAFASEQIPS